MGRPLAESRDPAARVAPQAAPSARAAAGITGDAAARRSDAATRVLRRFRLVFNAVKTHFQQVEKHAGIGGAQLWALSLVRAQPGIGVGALARAMDVHQTTASNLVRSLVEQGLVESHRSGIDRRATQLKVTRAGGRVLARAPGPFTGVLPEALARLDPATLERLDADLAVLLALLETDQRAARIPLAQL
jgi:DNA-binding MarR family transcriptional regulator